MNGLLLFLAYIITFVAVYYVAYKHGENKGYDDGLYTGKKSAQANNRTQ